MYTCIILVFSDTEFSSPSHKLQHHPFSALCNYLLSMSTLTHHFWSLPHPSITLRCIMLWWQETHMGPVR